MNKFKNKEGIVALFLAIVHFALWYYFAYIKFEVCVRTSRMVFLQFYSG